jgi:hypothetical protein
MELESIPQMQPDILLAVTKFLSSDLLQKEIQQLPDDLQEIFDMVLDSPYGNTLAVRMKMLRCKEIIGLFAQELKPFTEDEIQNGCFEYQNKKTD